MAQECGVQKLALWHWN